jgi:hypothetical protein
MAAMVDKDVITLFESNRFQFYSGIGCRESPVDAGIHIVSRTKASFFFYAMNEF